MNILMLGEYSGMYRELKRGFTQLGHHVVHASGGDGWKKISSDINLSAGLPGRMGFYMTALRGPFFMRALDLQKFDLIFVCNPMVFSPFVPPLLFDFFFKGFKGKFFLSIAGNDKLTYESAKNTLEYNFFDGDIADNNGVVNYLSPKRVALNDRVCAYASGFVPVSYTYSLGYESMKKPMKIIPLPVDLNRIKYTANRCSDRVIFFHGISRPGFKGTDFIVAALEKLKRRYPNDVEIRLPKQVPFNRYMDMLGQSNIVIDQANSYAYGMNAIIAMAMGKTVLSGAEPVAIRALGESKCPVVNIKPNSENIFRSLQEVLERKSILEQLGVDARKYVKRVHDSKVIAGKYIEFCQNEPCLK